MGGEGRAARGGEEEEGVEKVREEQEGGVGELEIEGGGSEENRGRIEKRRTGGTYW